MPGPQTEKQREFEVRVKEMGTQMAKRLGMSRRPSSKVRRAWPGRFLL